MSNSLVTPWTRACQTPLSIGFPSPEYWSGLPFPSLEDLPDPGIKPVSPALAGGFFATEPPGKPMSGLDEYICKRKRPQRALSPLPPCEDTA